MWICLNNGFVSAVEKWGDPDRLIVRARRREHLADNFANWNIETHDDRDYRYRIDISKEDFANIVKSRIMNIDYGNFKDSVRDDQLHNLYANFWTLHWRYQR